MENIASVENITLKGAFGDRKVLLCRCAPAAPNGANIVLLHGVHSSANLSLTNKFHTLAECLAGAGFSPWLVETSRNVRDRNSYGNDIAGWVRDAFEGKTFPQEQDDAFTALSYVKSAIGDAPIYVWGFSLGGIIALSAAASDKFPRRSGRPFAFDALILGGTGLVSYPEVEEWMLKLPILSTLRAALSPSTVSEVKTGMVLSFRGEHDEVFPRENAIDLLNNIPLDPMKKIFYQVDGADHGLRARNGKNDPSIMREMTDILAEESDRSLW